MNPAERPRHRVHLKRMLLSDSVDNLLPDWAYFVRASIDTTELRPTASREALFDDENLTRTREALGEAVRRWIVRLGTTQPDRLAVFLDVHHLGVKALALHDDELLALVHRWLPFETTMGPQHHRGGPARARRRPLRHLGGRVPSGRPGRDRARPGRRQRGLRLRRRPAQPHAAGARCAGDAAAAHRPARRPDPAGAGGRPRGGPPARGRGPRARPAGLRRRHRHLRARRPARALPRRPGGAAGRGTFPVARTRRRPVGSGAGLARPDARTDAPAAGPQPPPPAGPPLVGRADTPRTAVALEALLRPGPACRAGTRCARSTRRC